MAWCQQMCKTNSGMGVIWLWTTYLQYEGYVVATHHMQVVHSSSWDTTGHSVCDCICHSLWSSVSNITEAHQGSITVFFCFCQLKMVPCESLWVWCLLSMGWITWKCCILKRTSVLCLRVVWHGGWEVLALLWVTG